MEVGLVRPTLSNYFTADDQMANQARVNKKATSVFFSPFPIGCDRNFKKLKHD